MTNDRVPLSGNPILPGTEHQPAPTDQVGPDGQHPDHWVLPESERSSGHVRPIRTQYVHKLCGAVTRMPYAIAETYARAPKYYSHTFCCSCGKYLPVVEFYWDDVTRETVGS